MEFKLKQIAIAGMLTCLGASALAANYFFVTPKSMEMSKVAPFSVVLTPYSLPVGVVGNSYNDGFGFDFKTLLTVSGDPAYNPTAVVWSLQSGALPSGYAFTNGVLSGTPTTVNGQSVTVRADYKTSSGAQAFQLVTEAAALVPQVRFENASAVVLGSLSFPDTSSGTSSVGLPVVLRNTGTGPLVITGSGITVAAPFSISSTTCASATLAPAATCTVTVAFAPTAVQSFTG